MNYTFISQILAFYNIALIGMFNNIIILINYKIDSNSKHNVLLISYGEKLEMCNEPSNAHLSKQL